MEFPSGLSCEYDGLECTCRQTEPVSQEKKLSISKLV